jgi:hypothetical protein
LFIQWYGNKFKHPDKVPLLTQNDHLVAKMMEINAEAARHLALMRIELGLDRVVHHQEQEAEVVCYGFPMAVEVAVEVAHHFHHDN